MVSKNIGAVLAAGAALAVAFATPVAAADLGGNCCTDLEERIAELEATTTRKGNRKVSLTVSGWVTQQVMFWDDGVERNVYVHDLGTTLGSHFKFSGQANFAPGWNAGYVLHIEGISNNGLALDQEHDNGTGPRGFLVAQGASDEDVVPPPSMQIHQSYWFVQSDHLGKFSLGLQSQASDNAAILIDGSGSAIPANWVAFDVANFRLRRIDNNDFSNTLTWGSVGSCRGMGGVWGDCNGLPRKVARYDTPVFGGFSASASWGEDDMWDVAAHYAGVWGDFKLAAAAAYAETTDEGMGAPPPLVNNGNGGKLKYFQAGTYLEHLPTGLFGYGAYGVLDSELPSGPIFSSSLEVREAATFYVKGGVRQRWSGLGATVVYGEYLDNGDSLGFRRTTSRPGFSMTDEGSSSLEVWGLGLVQEVDAAAMSIWIKYRHMSFDLDFKFNGVPDTRFLGYQDFQYVGAGALINF